MIKVTGKPGQTSDQLKEELVKSLENAPGGLQVDDRQIEAEFYLTRKAKKALEKKAHNQSAQDEKGKFFLCTYFACRVPRSERDDGIKMVAAKINQLAARNLIHSALGHFVSYDLSPFTSGFFDDKGTQKEPEMVIACYVLVPEKVHKRIMEKLKRRVLKKAQVQP